MEAFEKEMRGTVKAVRGDVETLGKKHAQTTRLIGHVGVTGEGKRDALASGGRGRRGTMIESRREYPELVTRDLSHAPVGEEQLPRLAEEGSRRPAARASVAGATG